MGLFDDIADVHTGAKTKKQVLSTPSTKAFYDSKKSHTRNTGKKQTGKQILDSADKHGTPLRDEADRRGETIKTQDDNVKDLPAPKKLPEDKDGKKLNNPRKGNVKNYKVYVKNDKEDVVKIEFDTLKQEHFTTNLPKWKTQYWSSKIGVNR